MLDTDATPPPTCARVISIMKEMVGHALPKTGQTLEMLAYLSCTKRERYHYAMLTT